jgi:hypothetical protein
VVSIPTCSGGPGFKSRHESGLLRLRFLVFPQSLQANTGMIRQVRPRPLPSIPFPNHHSLLLSLDAVACSVRYHATRVVVVEVAWHWQDGGIRSITFGWTCTSDRLNCTGLGWKRFVKWSWGLSSLVKIGCEGVWWVKLAQGRVRGRLRSVLALMDLLPESVFSASFCITVAVYCSFICCRPVPSARVVLYMQTWCSAYCF